MSSSEVLNKSCRAPEKLLHRPNIALCSPNGEAILSLSTATKHPSTQECWKSTQEQPLTASALSEQSWIWDIKDTDLKSHRTKKKAMLMPLILLIEPSRRQIQ